MKISTEQVKKVLSAAAHPAPDMKSVDKTVIKLMDAELIAKLTLEVEKMGDREEMVAALKARIEAGEYQPTGDDIADAMIRRAVADSIA